MRLERLILATLQGRELHGYAITREIRSRSSAALRLGEWALYPALRRLEADGLVESVWAPEGDGSGRRVYRLTARGSARTVGASNEWTRCKEWIASTLSGRRIEEEANHG